MAEEWLTSAELSAEIKVPVGTLRQWRHRGYGPESVLMGGGRRYPRSAVTRWLSELQTQELDRVVA